MSKTQRLKSKKISSISEKQQCTDTMNSVPSRQRSLIFPKTNGQNSSQSQIHITKQKQLQLEEYRDLKNSNPKGLNFSLDAFPYSPGLDSKCNLPLAFSFSPLLILENENVTTMNKYIDEIPRCECKAYMNYYNEIEKGKFKCFLCNSLSYLGQYDPNKQPNDQRKSNLYQALGSPKFYESIAAQDYIVFLIDLSRQAFTSQMIHYAIAAIKQSLKNPQYDEYFVQIYGYDEQVYFFEFSDESQEPKCIIVDKTIQQDINFNSYKHQKMFKQYREICFSLLDELPQICEDNDKNSNFSHCFDYIYKLTKGTGAKYYILQASQSLVTKPFVAEDFKAEKQISNPIPVKSALESKNKKFFERYCTNFINNSTSISMFIFGKQYKNIKVFGDIFKLTNSELKYYSKDSVGELQKFYYQFSYLLTATYFKDVYVEFFISEAWRFTNVYGNCFRARNGSISFFANHIEPSKHFVILVNFSKSTVLIPTHCTVQFVINYRYKKEHYTTVVTSVQNLTGHIQKIYTGIDVYICLAAIARAYIVNLRINGEEAQKKLEQIAASIYESGLKIYKKNEDLPYEILSILAGTLAMKKSRFSKPQQIINTQLFDKVLSQRNHLQFSTINQVATTFMPILFDLNNMEQNMCLIENDQNFIYPNTLEAKFNNVKQGIFLMDSGLVLFLFIAKLCDLRLLQNLIGMQKIPKNHTLTEEILNQQQNFEAQQVKNLIKTLRQQKSFAWVPICIVHCGQNSRNEKEFYLQFYAEKYDQYQKYKYSFHEYLQILKKCERTS